jgi:transcriptional regulator with XRE-family HTH domain
MERSRRARPVRLAKKLRQIRTALGITQQQMFERLGETKTPLYRGHIGEYETGTREVLVLLRYARIAGVYVDVLIDDDLDLPDVLPDKSGYDRMMKRVRIRR